MTDELLSHTPIMFRPEMVTAILAGTKVQTRRLVTRSRTFVDGHGAGQVEWNALDLTRAWVDPGPSPAGNPGPYLKAPTKDDEEVHRLYPRRQPGDRLWVKEAAICWTTGEAGGAGGTSPFTVYQDDPEYAAVERDRTHLIAAQRTSAPAGGRPGWWRKVSALFMPRSASRLLLEVTGVIPQRLQQITEEDALAEGCAAWPVTALDEYEDLWAAVHGKHSPWASNPWVWRISFRRSETTS